MMTHKGFSLIEILVAIAIMLLILGVALFNHREFGNTVTLTNLAYDVALSVRKSQVFGISVREVSIGSDQFDVPYGNYFYTDPLTGENNYVFFADEDGDGRYDGSVNVADCRAATGELCEGFRLPENFSIEQICIETATVSCTNVDDLHVTYRRPEPNAIFDYGTGSSTAVIRADITLQSPEGLTKVVSIFENGNITVN